MKLKPSESIADQVRRMGRADFERGVSRDIGQQSWGRSLARGHWLEGWDEAKRKGFRQLALDFLGKDYETSIDCL